VPDKTSRKMISSSAPVLRYAMQSAEAQEVHITEVPLLIPGKEPPQALVFPLFYPYTYKMRKSTECQYHSNLYSDTGTQKYQLKI